MILLLYLAGVFISLFLLYAVSRHDFVLLRQSISLRYVFDNAFISLAVFFLISRIFFSLYLQDTSLLNPLKFFYLTRFWGILPYAGLYGIIISLLFFYRSKKNKLRILDIYFISFSPIILLDILLQANTGIMLPIKFISILVLLLFYGWFIKIHNKFSTKDGFITSLTFITYSLVTLAFSIASHGIVNITYAWFNALLVLGIVAFTIFLVLVQRDFFNKQ